MVRGERPVADLTATPWRRAGRARLRQMEIMRPDPISRSKTSLFDWMTRKGGPFSSWHRKFNLTSGPGWWVDRDFQMAREIPGDEILDFLPLIHTDLVERPYQLVQHIHVRCRGQSRHGVEGVKGRLDVRPRR